jgi:hypothetical protein
MLSCFYWCLWLPSYKIGAKKAALVVHMATLIRILYIKANMVSVCVDKKSSGVCLCGQKLGSAWKILPVTAPSMWSCLCVCLSRSRNEPHLAWNVPAPGAGRGGGETYACWILRLPAQTICLWQKRGPEMSRTWPEMFQRQVRVMVAERHTQAWEGGFVFPRAQSSAL